MRKLFFTGLVILLPFTLTLLIVLFVANLFTSPFEGTVASLLDYYGLLDHPFLFFSGEQILFFSSKLLALVALFVLIVLIGILGQMVIAKTIFRFSEYMIHRIPFVNKLYKSTQDVVQTVFKSKGSSFSQAALVPFPHPGAYSMGLISEIQTAEKHADNVLVFIPGTPNPTAGFMLTYKYEEIIFLDMKVEDAIKFMISCGTLNVEFS